MQIWWIKFLNWWHGQNYRGPVARRYSQLRLVSHNQWQHLRASCDPREQAIVRLRSYDRVFRGHGATPADCQLVLADLAHISGFYRVAHPGHDNLAFEQGKRYVFGHIFNLLRASEHEMAAMEMAARDEYVAFLSEQQGASFDPQNPIH